MGDVIIQVLGWSEHRPIEYIRDGDKIVEMLPGPSSYRVTLQSAVGEKEFIVPKDLFDFLTTYSVEDMQKIVDANEKLVKELKLCGDTTEASQK